MTETELGERSRRSYGARGSKPKDDPYTACYPFTWADDDGIIEGMSLRIDHVQPDHSCDLCKLLCGLRHVVAEQVSDTDTTLLCFVCDIFTVDEVVMCVVRLSRPKNSAQAQGHVPQAGFLETIDFWGCPDEKKLVGADPNRRLPKPLADFDGIKALISDAGCTHHKARGRQDWWKSFKTEIPGWRMIDCTTKIVVTLQECISEAGSFKELEYVTLSYVWGVRPSKDSTDVGNFPAQIPRVIEDAIKATLSLGFRYLWIDRYCIPKDDQQERYNQIRNMDLIYSRSCLTIIAAAGEGPRHGLPGVQKTPRLLPVDIRVGSHGIVHQWLSAEWVQKQIQHSKWNSRAWTFQEVALSPKRLYFTDYFTLFETITGKGVVENHIDGPEACEPPKFMPAWQRDKNHLWYVQSYIHRELSFETDVFLAFQGFQASRNKEEGTICLFYGLEIDTWDFELSRALWWGLSSTATGPKRRPAAPSWTWLGWRIPVMSWQDFWAFNSLSTTGDYTFRSLDAVRLDLVYDDGFVFPWRSMESKRLEELKKERDEGAVRFLIASGWTFGLDRVLSPPANAFELPFYELDPNKEYEGGISLTRKLKDSVALYGLRSEHMSDPSKALCLILGSMWPHGGLYSKTEEPQPNLLVMVVVSTNDGETWQRAEVLSLTCRRELENRNWTRYGWEERELRIY